MQRNEIAEGYALCYGWRVFPLQPRDKKPYPGSRGFKDATSDPEAVAEAWAEQPDSNIGIATGAVSGIVVLDIDPRHGGDRSLASLVAMHGVLPPTLTCFTGGGGRHYFFRHPGGTVACGADVYGDAYPGVDIRADGGYVVGAGSEHPDGPEYIWDADTLQFADALPELPAWCLTARVQAAARPATAATADTGDFLPASPAELSWARQDILNHPPAIQGHNGSGVTMAAATKLVRGHALTFEEALPLLELWNETCQPPWEQRDLERKLNEAINKSTSGTLGSRRETLTETASFDLDTPVTKPAVLSGQRQTEDDFDNTDLGNARRFSKQHGAVVRYVPRWEKWLLWTGTHWQLDDTNAIQRLAVRTVDAIHDEVTAARREFDRLSELHRAALASDLANGPTDETARLSQRCAAMEARVTALSVWANKSQAEKSIRALLNLARSLPGIAVASQVFDADPFLLSLQNGTLDLRSGVMRRHDPADGITRVAPVAYDGDAASPRWEAFLLEVMKGDADLVSFLQRAVGYSLTGSVTSQALFFMHGEGQNGKSTFINVLKSLLGPYASMAAASLLEAGERHPTEIADLRGARAAIISETEQEKALPMAQIKRLTSEEPLKARRMREDFWEFTPTHKLWVSGNHKPEVRGVDKGIWRRIKMIPFTYTVPDARKDPNLHATLSAELSGILNWALRGLSGWLEGGLQEPEAVTAATEEYRAEESPVGPFVDEAFERGPGFTASTTQVYDLYRQWADRFGFKPLNIKVFKRQMEAQGLLVRHTRGGNVWLGIKVRSGALQTV